MNSSECPMKQLYSYVSSFRILFRFTRRPPTKLDLTCLRFLYMPTFPRNTIVRKSINEFKNAALFINKVEIPLREDSFQFQPETYSKLVSGYWLRRRNDEQEHEYN